MVLIFNAYDWIVVPHIGQVPMLVTNNQIIQFSGQWLVTLQLGAQCFYQTLSTISLWLQLCVVTNVVCRSHCVQFTTVSTSTVSRVGRYTGMMVTRRYYSWQ